MLLLISIVQSIIYEEIRMGKDHKYRKLFEMQNENLFHNISYINSIGSIEDVRSFTYEEVKQCYDTFYNFSNQILVKYLPYSFLSMKAYGNI